MKEFNVTIETRKSAYIQSYPDLADWKNMPEVLPATAGLWYDDGPLVAPVIGWLLVLDEDGPVKGDWSYHPMTPFGVLMHWDESCLQTAASERAERSVSAAE